MKTLCIFLNCCIFLIAISCNNAKNNKQNQVNTNTADSNVSVSKTNNPDPSLEVKEDFNQLTKADEEREDKSHMDMSYFPSNYALTKALNQNTELKIRVTYSRPHKGARSSIFGTDSSLLVPYGKLWRLGANESSEIELLKPATIAGKKVPAGRYSMYAIPFANKWHIIFNKNIYTFGHFNYNPKDDVLKADALVSKRNNILETFLIYFQKTSNGCNMIITWDTEIVTLPVQI